MNRIIIRIVVAMLCVTAHATDTKQRAAVVDNSSVAEQPYVPDTVSPQARAELLHTLALPKRTFSAEQSPQTPAEWDVLNKRSEDRVTAIAKPKLEALSPIVSEIKLGGTPALKVEPKGGSKRRPILVYVHGGGFTLFSARSSLTGAALMAEKTGMTVYSIDYTVVPHAQWQTVTDQVINAYRALLAQGYSPKQVGMFGDSAGGSIVAGSVLKMRDSHIPMPGALVLLSPWSDVTETGETYHTLKTAEPILSMESLKPGADLYAPGDQKNPYVSPVYGDYSKGFPPTLIQGGTREIFLSNFVRQYRAIDAAGGTAVLDLYEGMTHVFQVWLAGTPESDTAFAKALAFWSVHLTK